MADAARCDNCSNHADRPRGWDRFQGPPQGPLPAGWVRVWATDNDDRRLEPSVSAEACGWPCAAAWLAKEAANRTDAVAKRNPRERPS